MHLVHNYGPIAFLCILNKLLDKHIYIYSLITSHLWNIVNLLIYLLWSFRQPHSIVSANFQTVHGWKSVLFSYPVRKCLVVNDIAISSGSWKIWPSWWAPSVVDRLPVTKEAAGCIRMSNVCKDTIYSSQESLLVHFISIYDNEVRELELLSLSECVINTDDLQIYKPVTQLEDFDALQSDLCLVGWWSNTCTCS